MGDSAPIIGHVGDGNFHCQMLIDSENEEELKLVKQLGRRMAE